MKKTVILAALIISATAAILYGLWTSRPVAEVYVAQRGTAVSAVYGTVKVVASMTINTHARNSGTIHFSDRIATNATVGLVVTQGELLATIVNEDLEREIAEAEADLKAAEERQRLGPPSLPELNAQQAQLARLEKLAEMQSVPASDLDRARSTVQTLSERMRNEQVEVDRVVAIDRERAGVLQDRKARCFLTSPLTGYLDTINCLNGEFITDGSTPFTVATKSMFLNGEINEEDVGQIAPKMKAAVRLYSYPDKDLMATVAQILPTANNQRYTVTLTLDETPANLMSGMTGEMNIIAGQRENALIIPSSAVLGGRVLVVKDQRSRSPARQGRVPQSGARRDSQWPSGRRTGRHRRPGPVPARPARPRDREKSVASRPCLRRCTSPSVSLDDRKKAIILSLGGIILGSGVLHLHAGANPGIRAVLHSNRAGRVGRHRWCRNGFKIAIRGAMQESAPIVSVKNERPRKYYEGITDAGVVMRRDSSSFPTSWPPRPLLDDSATVQTDFRSEVFRLQGIDLDAQLQATDLRSYMVSGDLADFRQKSSGILVGALLAQKLNLDVGNTVSITGPGGDPRSFEVSGIFRTGDNMIDEKRAYVHLRVAQSLFNKPSEVSFIIVKLRDPDRAPQLANHLENLLDHRSRSWQERESGNLQIFKAIRYSAAITVSTIIVLAGFGIFNILTLMVLEKVSRDLFVAYSRDVSVTYSSKSVRRSFGEENGAIMPLTTNVSEESPLSLLQQQLAELLHPDPLGHHTPEAMAKTTPARKFPPSRALTQPRPWAAAGEPCLQDGGRPGCSQAGEVSARRRPTHSRRRA